MFEETIYEFYSVFISKLYQNACRDVWRGVFTVIIVILFKMMFNFHSSFFLQFLQGFGLVSVCDCIFYTVYTRTMWMSLTCQYIIDNYNSAKITILKFSHHAHSTAVLHNFHWSFNRYIFFSWLSCTRVGLRCVAQSYHFQFFHLIIFF